MLSNTVYRFFVGINLLLECGKFFPLGMLLAFDCRKALLIVRMACLFQYRSAVPSHDASTSMALTALFATAGGGGGMYSYTADITLGP